MDSTQASILGKLVKNLGTSTNDIDNALNKYFIEHYYEAKNYNIYEIAEECNVSRSSIRRFCQKIGFENFFAMKTAMKQHNSKGKVISDTAYRKNLTSQISTIIHELDSRMDTDEIGIISQHIKEAENFYLLTENTENYVSTEFQVQLARYGKVVWPITTKKQFLTMKNQFKINDLIFSISVSGKYAQNIENNLKNCSSKSILFTANRLYDFTKTFSFVYYMSHIDKTSEAQIYREFGVPYILEIIANNYKSHILNPR